MFAFGSYSKGKETARANEWRAKNVTPILYREHWRHAYLHKTLRAWADTYRDGARGKERIVIEYAMARPDTATSQDDFVSRMLWALSDPNGVSAMRFAELDPVPSLDWLEPLGEEGFHHEDLIRFGVPPKASVDKNLTFSLTRRPAPYDLAPQMALADTSVRDTDYDNVMSQLARWLIRHLNNPALLLWLVKQGGKLHGKMATLIAHRMDELAAMERRGELGELDHIRSNAPDAIPDARMRTLWRLLLSGRVKLVGQDLDLYSWCKRLERDGLTSSLRLELREMLTPRVSLRDPFRWPFGNDDDEEEPEHIRQLVDWDIVLSANHVHAELWDGIENEHWGAALPVLLLEFTVLLRDVLDLMRELGGADDRRDLSYSSQPSISEHPQNSAFRDWTVLVELIGTLGGPRLPNRASEPDSRRKPGLRYPILCSVALRSLPPHRATLFLAVRDSGGCWPMMIGGCGRSRPSAKPCGYWSPWHRNSMKTIWCGSSEPYSQDHHAKCSGPTSRRSAGQEYRTATSGYGSPRSARPGQN